MESGNQLNSDLTTLEKNRNDSKETLQAEKSTNADSASLKKVKEYSDKMPHIDTLSESAKATEKSISNLSEENSDEAAEDDDNECPTWTCKGCGFSNDVDRDDPGNRVCVLCGKSDEELPSQDVPDSKAKIETTQQSVVVNENRKRGPVDFDAFMSDSQNKAPVDPPVSSLKGSSREELKEKILAEMRMEDNISMANKKAVAKEEKITDLEDEAVDSNNTASLDDISDQGEVSDFAYSSGDSDFALKMTSN